MENEPEILGINGSPNRKSLTASLLKEALERVEYRGLKTKTFHLIDELHQPYHSNYSKTPESDFKRLYLNLKKSKGFILATPTYWMAVSSLMKNFIEKLTVTEEKGFELEGKVAGFIATCEEDGGWKAVLDMAGPLSHMGVIFPPYSMFFYNKKFPNKSERGWMKKDIKLMADNVVELYKAIDSYKPNWDYRK